MYSESERLIRVPGRKEIIDFRSFGNMFDALRESPQEVVEQVLRDPDALLHHLQEAERPHEEDPGAELKHIFLEGILHLADTIDHGRVIGNGKSNTFVEFGPDAVREQIPASIAKYVGMRELKREVLYTAKGEPYYGIPKDADRPDPFGANWNSVAMQVFGHNVKGVFPQPFFLLKEVGAHNLRTGTPIEGLEDEVVRTCFFMEVYHGLSVADVLDREGIHWEKRYSATSEQELRDFLDEPGHQEYFEWSVREAMRQWPAIRYIDWDALHTFLTRKIMRMNGMEDGSGLKFYHFDLHFGNVMLLFTPDGLASDHRIAGFIDPDLSTISADPAFGTEKIHTLYKAKSTCQDKFFMPDHIPAGMTEKVWGGPVQMDALGHLRQVFSVIKKMTRRIEDPSERTCSTTV